MTGAELVSLVAVFAAALAYFGVEAWQQRRRLDKGVLWKAGAIVILYLLARGVLLLILVLWTTTAH